MKHMNFKLRLQSKVGKVLLFFFISLFALSFLSVSSATQITRSSADRPDDTPGYQIHFVYVVPSGTSDKHLDTEGSVNEWANEANIWLYDKLGHKFIFDTYGGATDVSFLQSRYKLSDLCHTCSTGEKLETEFQAQNTTKINSKTLVFIIFGVLDTNSCGWASSPGNLVILHSISELQCNSPGNLAETGLTSPTWSLIHELVHTYGISHKCFDATDLMLGVPECTIDDNTYGRTAITVDSNKNHYVGSDSSDGIDLLRLPIWSDGSGDFSYAEIEQMSSLEHIPTLEDGLVYAVVGQRTQIFAWDWEKKFYPKGNQISCQFSSGVINIKGDVKGESSACTFNIPSNLRAGKEFTVIQTWVDGPWHGEATVTGTLVRKDYSSNACTKNICYVGGSTTLPSSCWPSDVSNLTLQNLVDGKWVDLERVRISQTSECAGVKYPNSPEFVTNFDQTGTFVFRWVSDKTAKYSSRADDPFAVVVNDEVSPEPSQAEINAAQLQAASLGKQADLEKAKADAVALAAKNSKLKTTTITCKKGQISKKITAVKPVCPSGYKKIG